MNTTAEIKKELKQLKREIKQSNRNIYWTEYVRIGKAFIMGTGLTLLLYGAVIGLAAWLNTLIH